MRIPRIILAILAGFVLVVACAQGARDLRPPPAPVTFVIDNQNYHAANFYLYCDGSQVKVVAAIEMNQRRTIAYDSERCRVFGWIVRLSLSNEQWIVDNLMLEPDAEVHISVSNVLVHSGFLVR